MTIRPAKPSDVARMVELAALKRSQYAAYSPVFWHPAAGAAENQQKYFESLVDDPAWICLVHDAAAGLDGFIIARVVSSPPVYNPGGKVCMIDDFMVTEPSLWKTVGIGLHEEAERISARGGAKISVTVCGERDVAKRTELRKGGAHVASEWYVHEIGDHKGDDSPQTH